MFSFVNYESDPLDGIVSRIQNVTHINDVITAKYVQIYVPSKSTPSKEPCVLFGINLSTSANYWSSEGNEPNKYIKFAFKYPILLNGIGLSGFYLDWFAGYKISTSSDSINFDSSCDINVTDKGLKLQNVEKIYAPLNGLKPRKFIIITTLDPWQEYSKNPANFALYGVDFFGKMIKNYHNHCCTHNSLNSSYLLHFFTIIILYKQ